MNIVRRKLLAVLFALLGATLLMACGQKSADLDSSEAVNIRFDNQTGLEINSLFLGTGSETSGANTRYKNIGDGELSDYLTVAPVVSDYSHLQHFHEGDGRVIGRVGAHDFLAIEELEVGTFYTVTIEIDPEDDRDAVITNVTIDDPSE